MESLEKDPSVEPSFLQLAINYEKRKKTLLVLWIDRCVSVSLLQSQVVVPVVVVAAATAGVTVWVLRRRNSDIIGAKPASTVTVDMEGPRRQPPDPVELNDDPIPSSYVRVHRSESRHSPIRRSPSMTVPYSR